MHLCPNLILSACEASFMAMLTVRNLAQEVQPRAARAGRGQAACPGCRTACKNACFPCLPVALFDPSTWLARRLVRP